MASDNTVAAYDEQMAFPVGRHRVRRLRRHREGLLLLCALFVMTPARSNAQVNNEFLSRSSPQPTFQLPEPANYNIKIGETLKARIYGSFQVEFNDNINLSASQPKEDILFAPNARIGFVYPISENQRLEFNLGLGYRWYLNSPSVSSIAIDPTSRIDHDIQIGNINLRLFDNFSVQVDPTLRGEISGTNGALVNFRRFHNTAGVMASWAFRDDMSAYAGYDYTIDRSLSDDFISIDRDEHTFSAGLHYSVLAGTTLTLSSSYTISEYVKQVQNNGTTFTIGPSISHSLTRFIDLNFGVAYSASSFDSSGTITDTSEFSGVTYRGSIRHSLNKRMNHYVQVSKGTSLGLGSNYTENFAVQYGFNVGLNSYLRVNSSLSYEKLSVSGTNGDESDRILFYIGTGYQLTKRWHTAVGYALTMKDSALPDRDYTQNRLTIDLSREF